MMRSASPMNSINPSTTLKMSGVSKERPRKGHALQKPRPAYRTGDLHIGALAGRHMIVKFDTADLNKTVTIARVQSRCFHKNNFAQCLFRTPWQAFRASLTIRVSACKVARRPDRRNRKSCTAALFQVDICCLRMSLRFSCIMLGRASTRSD